MGAVTETNNNQSAERYALPLPPDLDQPPPNSNLPIYTGRMSASAHGLTLAGDATVEIRWDPQPALICRIEFDPGATSHDLQLVIAGDLNQQVELRVEGGVGPASRRGGSWNPDAPWGEFRIYDTLTIQHDGEASEIRCELLNMSSVYGAPVSYGEYSWGADLLEMSSDRWSVELQALQDLRTTIKTLQQTGGYGITHICRATLNTGDTVEPGMAERFLTPLQYALSFAENRWVTPVRTRGLTRDGSVAWEIWGLWNTDPWSSPMTWFSHRSVDGLAEVFRAIDDHWPDQYWERLLHTSTHYYLDASHGLVNRQVIMAGALLELIGWHVVVEERKLLSAKGYDRLETSDRLRMTLRLMDYPLEIPSDLRALLRFAKPTWDIATALAEVRHSVVHARRHQSSWEMDSAVWADVACLSQETCNVALLFLLGYRGRYVNQITAQFAADDGPVPWSPEL